jgi:hypothetical protein
MLTVVRDTDTAEDVAARLRANEQLLAEIAAAPVRHVPPAFLAAVEGLFPELLMQPLPERTAR